jgi:hypothetical protein
MHTLPGLCGASSAIGYAEHSEVYQSRTMHLLMPTIKESDYNNLVFS